MTRLTDLAHNIRESHKLMRDYEAILQTSPDPKEKARARREIAEQRRLVADYSAEYRALSGGALPDDLAHLAAAGPLAALDTPEAETARRCYLAALREQYNVVETHAFTAKAQDERVGQPRRLPLLGPTGVYVPLRFDAPLPEEEAERLARKVKPAKREPDEAAARPDTLADVLRLWPGHLAVIGDAGSGKTTLLHVLISVLAAENPAGLAPDLASLLPTPRPLPVFLPLRLFERACGRDDAPSAYTRSAPDLLRFVDDWFSGWCPAANLPPGFLADHIRAGRAWLLLDALDEVADPTHRETMRNVIKELAGYGQTTRLIVTARVAAYRHTPLNDLFTVVTVRDLDDEQRQQMVRAIYTGLELPDAAPRAAALAGRFQSSDILRGLGRTPVMVWTAAVIHVLHGELPESRAALYDAYVDILLKKSFERTRFDTAAVDELTEGQGWAMSERREYLAYAAFELHRRLEDAPERPAQGVIDEDELAGQILAPYLRQQNPGLSPREARQRAHDFLGLMVERSGLLYETEQGYTIGSHLTMQEFMAAFYLCDYYRELDPAGYESLLRDKVGHSWWREVWLLAAGYLAEKHSTAAQRLLQHISQQGADPAGQLAALALAGDGLRQLRARLRRPSWYASLAQDLAGRLYRQLYANPPVAAPIVTRQEAGLALGWLYNDEDPRFAHSAGQPDFIRLEAGWFWQGDDDSSEKDEKPRHRVYLDTFELAKYPTTNAMFARFVADGGYKNKDWWAAAIADDYWCDGIFRDFEGERNQPKFWDDPRFNNPAQPVVGVTWYEAMAYCAWLTVTLNDGYTYRLPTEAEWERAARGKPPSPAGRGDGGEGFTPGGGERGGAYNRYPWGNNWRENHCNSKETGLQTTSPVGLFPLGTTASGLVDMVGNVYEWCQDWYAGDYYAQAKEARNPTGPKNGSGRVLRGGSWADEGEKICRCGYRNYWFPNRRNDDWGFRCARILSA